VNIEIATMQVFNGISLFSILALMALGLAIIFGLMGVINMAHGELMTLGAYTTYFTSVLFLDYMPSIMAIFLPVAIVFAFIVTFIFGYLVERGLIRFLYDRPLDTLLATWGLSLIMQQGFRSLFSPREVPVPLPHWLTGAWQITPVIQIPLNRMFLIGLTILVSVAVLLLLYKSRWGLKIRAVTQNRVMSGAAGINTHKVDALTFALGSGLAGVAGSSFTMLGATGPTAGQAYIVDTFIVVVFGGVQSLLGTFLSAFAIAETQSTLEFFLTGSMAKVSILILVIVALYFRPNGLFASKVRR